MGGNKIERPELLDLAKIKGKKILAVGAHSDDLEFCAGGTLLQLSNTNEIFLVVATDGQMGTHDHEQDHGELSRMRFNEAKIAAKKMGAKEISFWSYPDLDLINRRKHLLRRFIKLLLKLKPDLVFSFDPWGRYEAYTHPDHRTLAMVIAEGVLLATLPKWVQKNGLGKRFLSPKPQLWFYAPAEANIAVDVSHVWDERINLLKVFVSQFDNDFQWEKNEKWLIKIYSQIGSQLGVNYAEAFRILEYDGEWNK